MTVSAIVLLAAALPWTFSNVSRPLIHVTKEGELKFPLLTVDRELLYFSSAPNAGRLYESYVTLARDIRSHNAVNIGLVMNGEPWEYPLWILIKQENPLPVRIEHIEVENESRLIPRADFKPDFVARIN